RNETRHRYEEAANRERGRRLVALAGRNSFPASLHGPGVSGGRLRLGAGGPQHDRSLHAESQNDELVGRARGRNPDFALGRSERKSAPAASASGLSSHSTHGARAAGQRGRSSRVTVAHAAQSRMIFPELPDFISSKPSWNSA